MSEPILDIRDLVVTYPGRGFRMKPTTVLHGVSLDIRPGETVGLVGESGSGKSTLGRAVLGLAPITSGSVRLVGEERRGMSSGDRRRHARDVQAVFQDPYTSLNPTMSVGEILAEPLTQAGISKNDAGKRIADLLDRVGLPADARNRRAREFSGGQRQRIAIARALALQPRLIICDEPVSALDLTTQARVLDLFIEIQRELNVAYLFVSHDLSVVRHISHRVAVMYRGEIVENGDGDAVTRSPEHPYTQRLLLASPVPDPAEQMVRRADRHRLIAQQAEADEQAGVTTEERP